MSLVTQWIIPGNLNFPPARTQSTQSAQRTQYRHFSSGIALPSLVYLYSLITSRTSFVALTYRFGSLYEDLRLAHLELALVHFDGL